MLVSCTVQVMDKIFSLSWRRVSVIACPPMGINKKNKKNCWEGWTKEVVACFCMSTISFTT